MTTGVKGAGRATRKVAGAAAGAAKEAAGTVKDVASSAVEKISEKMPFGEKPETSS